MLGKLNQFCDQMENLPKIILVEDNLTFRQGLKSVLTHANMAHVNGEASNGLQFLEMLSSQTPDLVIMDIDMPLMDGMEATQKALEIIPHLKIIAFSMFGEKEYVRKMKNL